MLSDIDFCLSQLAAVISQALLTHPNSVTAIPRLDKFSGDITKCKGFLLQCSLYSTTLTGSSGQQKIAQFMNLLTGCALKWATTVWNHGGQPTTFIIAS